LIADERRVGAAKGQQLLVRAWDSAFERTTGGFLWFTKSEDESSFLGFGICGAGSEDPMN
jgi:hypothetical protein